jgi:hypothetical protein
MTPYLIAATKEDKQTTINTLELFLKSKCILDPTRSCDFYLFRCQYNLFCTKHRIIPIKLYGDVVAPVWKLNNITRQFIDVSPALIGVYVA